MSNRIGLTLFILLIAIGAIVYVAKNERSSSATIAENISLTDFRSNETVDIDFASKPTVLLFFTSWCPYCNEDAPKIVSLQEKYGDAFNIFGVNLIYRDTKPDLADYIARHRINYPVLLDETGDVYKHFGETGFPALFFVNARGEVTNQIVGSTDAGTIEQAFVDLKEQFSKG